MELEIGIVCGRCESYAALGTTACQSCAHGLALALAESQTPGELAPTGQEATPPGSKAPPTTESVRGEGAPKRTASAENGHEARDRGLGVEFTTTRELDLGPSNASVPPVSSRSGGSNSTGKFAKSKNVEELMDQAKNFVCRSCSTPVPLGHKFCGRCGAAVPPEILNARTQFFGQLQAPGKAKLILIRGEGVEGLSYQLNAEQHVVGKAGQLVFPDDPFVSPRHANFYYKNGVLCVRDEGSLNGVYLRVRDTVDISPEDHFLAGEQVFRVDGPPKLNDTPGPDGTYFYSSPKHQSPFRITQVLQGGAHGMTVCARSSSLQIGREGGDLNFPTDLYMSGSHCKIEETPAGLKLTDLSSRNGTYIRLKTERELGHGDYLFIGRKLLRVEITAA